MKVISKKSTQIFALKVAATLLTSMVFTGVVYAQDEGGDGYEGKPKSSTLSGSAAAASERGRQRKAEQAAKGKGQTAETGEKPDVYPQATRTDPKIKASNKGAKALRDMLGDYDAKKYADTLPKVDAVGAEPSSNAYDKSFAYQLGANAAGELKQTDKAIDYYKKALDANGLDNNGHYQVMYNLAILQNEQQKHAEALATIDRFLTETKSDKPEAISFKAYLLSQLDRAPEAAAMYEKILASKPNDKATLMNAVALYQQAENFQRANQLMDIARKQGMLTDAKEYRTLYVGLINSGKLKEALGLIDEGIAKGAIKPSQTLANDYAVIAQTAYGDENTPMAIEMYKRAAAISDNGEAMLNLARVLRNEGRIGEARQAAQQALNKGVKKPEDAKKIIALPGK